MAVVTKFNFHYRESRMRQFTCFNPFSSGCSLNMNIIIDMGPLSLKSSVNQSLSLLCLFGGSAVTQQESCKHSSQDCPPCRHTMRLL